MHTHSVESWQHPHVFLGAKHDRHERRTWFVVALTAAMMLAEIVGGTLYGSMAVVADGWHMSTHAGALAIAALAYRFARRHARDARFTFGTGKVGELERFPFDLNRNSRRDSHGLANQILSSPTGTVGAGDGEGILDGP